MNPDLSNVLDRRKYLANAGQSDPDAQKWIDSNNPRQDGDYVRERGDGTLTQVKNGRALDANGNSASGLSSPEAHFPRDEWKFRP